MKPYLCIEPQCPSACEGCNYAVAPDDEPRQIIARLLCTFALNHDRQPFADGANPLVDRARAYLRNPGPRLWIVEHGAVGLPHGNPSRLTTFEAYDTEGEALEAAEVSEFNARVFSVFVPPDGECCPEPDESMQAVDSQGKSVLPDSAHVSGVEGKTE